MGQAIVLSAGTDVDIMIHGVFSYELFGNQVWITTTHICLLIIWFVIAGVCLLVNRTFKHAQMVPKGFQNVIEIIVEMLNKMVGSTMGTNAAKFANYIGTIFIFILFCNISGLFGLRPPTADFGVTFPLALITFAMIHFNKFKHQKVKGVIAGLLDPWPFWAPINIIGDLAVPVSLSLRLFANVLSGTVMLTLVYGLLPKIAIAWPGALHVYFDLFSGAIQTYVFCMLTMTYVNDAIGESA